MRNAWQGEAGFSRITNGSKTGELHPDDDMIVFIQDSGENDMGKNLAIVCLVCAVSAAKAAVTLADWTFEGTPTSTATPATGFTYGVADSGNQTVGSSASGLHASVLTAWSFPAGNGSAKGFDADHWAVNDYFQFAVSTAGYSQISVSFDQISSATGPGKFLFEYSTDGSTFTPLGSDYTIAVASWSSSSHTTSSTFTEDIASITGLNDDSAVVFRLVDDSTISENGGTVGTAGASHVDNFIVNGTVIPVPEPAGWGAISGVGLLGICGLREWRRWRKQKCRKKIEIGRRRASSCKRRIFLFVFYLR